MYFASVYLAGHHNYYPAYIRLRLPHQDKAIVCHKEYVLKLIIVITWCVQSKLQDLAEGGMEAVLQAYQKCYVDHFGEESLINWKCLNNCEHGQVHSYLNLFNTTVLIIRVSNSYRSLKECLFHAPLFCLTHTPPPSPCHICLEG